MGYGVSARIRMEKKITLSTLIMGININGQYPQVIKRGYSEIPKN